MSPPKYGDEWRAAEVRFWESGRSRQTPTAIFIHGRWQDVHLMGESLIQPAGAAGSYERRFMVRTMEGETYFLRRRLQGPWRIKFFNPRPNACGRLGKY